MKAYVIKAGFGFTEEVNNIFRRAKEDTPITDIKREGRQVGGRLPDGKWVYFDDRGLKEVEEITMTYNVEDAAKKLVDALAEMQKISSNTGVRLSQAHLYSDALVALSQASACRLSPFARAMALIGMSMELDMDIQQRQVEDPKTREQLGEARVNFLHLTEDLVTEALKESCGCRDGSEPARLIGDMFVRPP